MKTLNRYITIEAVVLSNNEIVPIWDERLTFQKTEMYGNQISVKGEHKDYYNTTEVVYDLKTKTVLAGVEISHNQEPTHKIGDTVLTEVNNNSYRIDKIVDIRYESFEMNIKKGKKFDKYEIPKDNSIDIEPDTIYCIKSWKPKYICESGLETEYDYKIRKLVK